MPATYFSSVSVFTKDSALADALSTALFCMSYEDGLALVHSIGGVDAIWVDSQGIVKVTDRITFYSE
jgi:thiamine biosynthesis lipoprotein